MYPSLVSKALYRIFPGFATKSGCRSIRSACQRPTKTVKTRIFTERTKRFPYVKGAGNYRYYAGFLCCPVQPNGHFAFAVEAALLF